MDWNYSSTKFLWGDPFNRRLSRPTSNHLRIQYLIILGGRSVVGLGHWLTSRRRSVHGSLQDHQQGTGIVLHSALDGFVNNIHQIDPMFFIFTSHAGIALVGNVIKGLSVCEYGRGT